MIKLRRTVEEEMNEGRKKRGGLIEIEYCRGGRCRRLKIQWSKNEKERVPAPAVNRLGQRGNLVDVYRESKPDYPPLHPCNYTFAR